MKHAILAMDKATKTYRRRGRQPVAALREATLTLRAGELRTVYGPSGSGKSTLLLTAGGLLRPDSGTVTVAGREIYSLSSEERSQWRARHIGFVFQQFHLIPYLNVIDNVLAPLLAGVGDGEELPARAEALIERFGLGHRRLHPPAELSIGERQRVALARALLHEPRLLLADEPTGNLDEENGRLVLEALASFAARGGAVLVVTHDGRVQTGDSYRLEQGEIMTASADGQQGSRRKERVTQQGA